MREKEKRAAGEFPDGRDRIFLAHIQDLERICREQNYITHTKFLDLRQRSLAAEFLEKQQAERFCFFGGYPGAERNVLLFYPDYWEKEDVAGLEDSPVCLIRAEKNPMDKLTHRDYLGSLMGLGIQRECIGDILVTQEGAELLVLREIRDFLLTHYEKAGRKRLRLSAQPLEGLRPAAGGDSRLVRSSVASVRLDAVLAAAFGFSRGEAADWIRKGLVYQNYRLCGKADGRIAAGDVLTVRGKGKAEILSVGGESRKGRTFLEIRRFL